MANEFATTCKDFVKDGVVMRKGCGLSIVMKKDLTEGKWHPYNVNGSPHRHDEPPKDTKKIVQLPVAPTEEYIVDVVKRRFGLVEA